MERLFCFRFSQALKPLKVFKKLIWFCNSCCTQIQQVLFSATKKWNQNQSRFVPAISSRYFFSRILAPVTTSYYKFVFFSNVSESKRDNGFSQKIILYREAKLSEKSFGSKFCFRNDIYKGAETETKKCPMITQCCLQKSV